MLRELEASGNIHTYIHIYTHTHALLFKRFSLVMDPYFRCQTTLKFICLNNLNNKIRYIKLLI